MIKKTALGIVGAGYIATNSHLPGLITNSNVKIASICDNNRAAAEKIAIDYDIPLIYNDVAKMLKEVRLDAVDILTPPQTHAQIAKIALENGCHVLLEKPLAITKEDADSLIRLAREQKRSLNVMHNWSYIPCFRRARALVESGYLGNIVGIDLRYIGSINYERYNTPNHWIHSLEGGAFSDIAPHLVMLLLDFLDDIKVVNVNAKKTCKLPFMGADHLNVLVNSKKAFGSFTLSLNTPGFICSANIYGTRSSIFIDADTNIIIKYQAPKSSEEYLSRSAKARRALKDITQRTRELANNVTSVATGRAMPSSSKFLIDAFIDSINGKGKYPIDIEKARDVVVLLEEIYKSIQK
jgi:predicted dehydrogenase